MCQKDLDFFLSDSPCTCSYPQFSSQQTTSLPSLPTLGQNRCLLSQHGCGRAHVPWLYGVGERWEATLRLVLPASARPDHGGHPLCSRCSVTWRLQVVAGPPFREERVALSPSTGTGSSTSRALAASVGTSGWGTTTSTGSPGGQPGYAWRWR